MLGRIDFLFMQNRFLFAPADLTISLFFFDNLPFCVCCVMFFFWGPWAFAAKLNTRVKKRLKKRWGFRLPYRSGRILCELDLFFRYVEKTVFFNVGNSIASSVRKRKQKTVLSHLKSDRMLCHISL